MKKKGNSKKVNSKVVNSKNVGIKVKKEIKHQTFWAIMGIFFLVSFIFLINTIQDNSNLTGRVAVQTISYALKGTDLSFEVRDVPNVKDITINLADNVKGGNIKFVDIINPIFEGVVISAFNVTKNDVVKINSFKMTLKLKEVDILSKGLTNNEVQLYLNGNSLPIKLIYVKEGYVFYQASGSMLGEFVIGKMMEKKVELVVKKGDSQIVVVKEIEQPPVLEKPMPVVESLKDNIAGEAIATGQEEKGFFSKIADFFNNLFN